jgi:hypothetical protein
MQENMWSLSLWTWLASLKMNSPFPTIYLWMTKCQSSLWLNKIPLCIYLYILIIMFNE